MEITEVRIKLMEDNSGSNERLQAFCSITFDDMFVIRDLKIIEGRQGLLRRDAVAEADRPLPHLRHQEPPAEPLLQPVRLPARREPRDPRRRRPRQAARRHRPPDQLDVPREDPVGGPRLVRRRARTVEDAGLRLAVRRPRRRIRRAGRRVGAAVPPAGGGPSPPLRRGPLRGHTQHTRGNQSVLRGPHVPPRKEGTAENIASDRGDAANGFGSGL